MLFLVTGHVEISHYMRDDKDLKNKTRLVEAENEYEAEQKFLKHFNDMTDEYCVYYWATVHEVSEVIV